MITANFSKITKHCYAVKNQNGLNAALYDFFNAGQEMYMSKKEVRALVEDIPPYYPIAFVIVDMTFECGRIELEFLNLKYCADIHVF